MAATSLLISVILCDTCRMCELGGKGTCGGFESVHTVANHVDVCG